MDLVLSEKESAAFARLYQIGIAKELHRNGLLSDAQLEALLAGLNTSGQHGGA